MKNYRYGGFKLVDNLRTMIEIVVLLIFSILSVVLDVSYVLSSFAALLAVTCMWQMLRLHIEQFVLQKDSIIVYAGKKTRTINLPTELTLIVSYADVCIPLDAPMFFKHGVHTLNGKYSISIIQKMQLNSALEVLHRIHVKKYTTSVIRHAFEGDQLIYDFVCDQHILNRLIQNRKCLLIVPKTLKNEIDINSCTTEVYIDEEC